MTHKSLLRTFKILWIFVACFNVIPSFAEIPDAVLVNQQTCLSVRNNKLYITRSYELRINNRLGEKYTEISIPYSKMNKVSKIEGYIKDENGVIIKKLKSGDIIERSTMQDFSFYEDNFVKEFSLIHNIYPYTLCYSYQLQEDEFYCIDEWMPVINSDIPTLKASLTLDVPTDYKISFSSHLIDSVKMDTLETRIKYSWMTSYSKQYEPEIFSPEKSMNFPEVDIVPVKFKYDQEGSFASWEKYGNWEYRLMDGLNILPEDEQRTISSLITGIKDDKEKVRILYHYMQDATRYINISVKTGGMKPYPASYVAINKYGDCKALSNYFRSVLSFVGIKSFYSDVQADRQIKKTDLTFPSQQFNHIIVYVPLPKDTLWLDCTSDGPFNYLGTFTQNRLAFLIDKDDSHFKKTPALSTNDVLESRTIHIHSESENDITADFHTVSKGESYDLLSGLSSSVSDSRRSQYIRNNIIASGFDLKDYQLIPSNRDSTFITLNYTAKGNKFYKKYGNEILIPLLPFSIPAFKDPKNRKNPVQLNYPVFKQDSIVYEIPVGYNVSGMPKEQTIHSVFGNYSIHCHQYQNSVVVFKSFILNAGEYPLSQYKDFYGFVKKAYDSENYSYIVTTNK